jgi:ABC-type dipeptide/oligopeptide/nickel transport system permease subunit
VILLVIMIAVAIGPWLWNVPINQIDFNARLAPPSWQHPFGTDDLGQDLLARMLYGGRISLAVGLSAMTVAMTVGAIIGAIAGMSRGAVGSGLMWLTDLFLSLPTLPLLLLVIYLFRDSLKGLFGPEGGMFILIDYFLTASISSLSGLHYFQVLFPPIAPYVVGLTLAVIIALGILNWWGIQESAMVSAASRTMLQAMTERATR